MGENDQPPPEFAPYYRADVTPSLYGTSSQLRDLADGYFGLSWVFLLNVVLNFGLFAASSANSNALMMGYIVVYILLVGGASFPFNRKIALGRNWGEGLAMLASFLMAVNSVLCCGIIGYAVMQSFAMQELKKYGLGSTFLGLKKPLVLAKIKELEAAEFAMKQVRDVHAYTIPGPPPIS